MQIYYHPKFKRAYKKLTNGLKSKAEAREVLFRENPFDVRLDTHKLHGKLQKQWSFSITKNAAYFLSLTKKMLSFLMLTTTICTDSVSLPFQ